MRRDLQARARDMGHGMAGVDDYHSYPKIGRTPRLKAQLALPVSDQLRNWYLPEQGITH